MELIKETNLEQLSPQNVLIIENHAEESNTDGYLAKDTPVFSQANLNLNKTSGESSKERGANNTRRWKIVTKNQTPNSNVPSSLANLKRSLDKPATEEGTQSSKRLKCIGKSQVSIYDCNSQITVVAET